MGIKIFVKSLKSAKLYRSGHFFYLYHIWQHIVQIRCLFSSMYHSSIRAKSFNKFVCVAKCSSLLQFYESSALHYVLTLGTCFLAFFLFLEVIFVSTASAVDELFTLSSMFIEVIVAETCSAGTSFRRQRAQFIQTYRK